MSSAETTGSSIPPHCWKYVNWEISVPSIHTCQPTPAAPSVGDSQSSSTSLRSCSSKATPSERSESKY